MSDDEFTKDDQTGLAGGGRVMWCIEGADETVGSGLDLDIRTAVINRNARYFNESGDAGPQKLVMMGHKLRAIQTVVDALNEGRRNCSGLEYRVDEPYYPDEYDHLIDLSGVPIDELQSAFQGAQTELLQQGFFVNSVRVDDDGRLEELHVVRKRMADSTRAHGLRAQEEETDA